MTNEELEQALAAAINNCLEASGKDAVQIHPDTVPLTDILGFDSLCAVEVLVDVESNCGITAEIEVFLEGKGKKARNRTIKEIAAAMNRN